MNSKSSNDDTEGKVSSIPITGIKAGILTYHTPTTDSDKGWLWAFPSPDKKETFTADITNFPVPNTIAEEKKLLATFFPASCRKRKSVQHHLSICGKRRK